MKIFDKLKYYLISLTILQLICIHQATISNKNITNLKNSNSTILIDLIPIDATLKPIEINNKNNNNNNNNKINKIYSKKILKNYTDVENGSVISGRSLYYLGSYQSVTTESGISAYPFIATDSIVNGFKPFIFPTSQNDMTLSVNNKGINETSNNWPITDMSKISQLNKRGVWDRTNIDSFYTSNRPESFTKETVEKSNSLTSSYSDKFGEQYSQITLDDQKHRHRHHDYHRYHPTYGYNDDYRGYYGDKTEDSFIHENEKPYDLYRYKEYHYMTPIDSQDNHDHSYYTSQYYNPELNLAHKYPYYHTHYVDESAHKRLLAKSFLIPLASATILGITAALVNNPLLLQLGTLSGATTTSVVGKRKRRDLKYRLGASDHTNI